MNDPRPAETSTTASGFSFNHWFVLFSLTAVPLMIALGFWQLDRAQQKTAALAEQAARHQQGPVYFQQLALVDDAELNRLQVFLEGEYVQGRDFVLDNRIRNGTVGYEALSVFTEIGGQSVLVNRGWIKAPRIRDQLPEIPAVRGPVTLHAQVYVPPADRRDPSLYAQSGWPKRVQALSVTEMGELADVPLYDYILLLDASSPGALDAQWPVVNMPPDKHRAYAAQWFLMAVALTLITVFGGTNFLQWMKHRD